ncbi:NUDIX hydrolase [Oceanobacillus sp. CF4.6]|uniref:NUDIX hydrolase n=1 Tax=Oceanobacillus sp. CF4.6 TaxID=3373080 RepID=UPI003EE4D87B
MDSSTIIGKLQNRIPSIMGHENFRKSAVLVPLVEIDNETHLLFEVRSLNMRSQPGDICFPGGRIDRGDPDPKYCAIRETTEELGIHSENIKDVIPLDYVVNDLGRIIYPFVGRIANINEIIPNKSEVEEVFTVPLSYLLNTEPEQYKVNFHITPEDDFPFHLIVGGEDYNWQVRHINEIFYKYEEKVIWGLTAKILTHLIGLLDNE